jgi:hypothetical protein
MTTTTNSSAAQPHLSCHPNVTAEPVGYLTRPVETYKWMDRQEQVVVFECDECGASAESNITREQWLGEQP